MNQIEAMWNGYYGILGIKPHASSAQIKSAYRLLARQYHPDVLKSGSMDRMIEINEAYEVLSNRLKKAAYDRVLEKQRIQSKEEFYHPPQYETSAAPAEPLIYSFEPLMVAADELSKGKTREEIVAILVGKGVENYIAVEIVNEVFRARTSLRRKTAIETIILILFAIAMAVFMTAITYSIAPTMDITTNFISYILFIGGIIAVFKIYQK